MRYLMPRPLPDELVGSAWIRAVRRTGVPIAVATRIMTGGRKFSPSLFTLAHLAELGAFLRIEPQELLWEHTFFPYVTAYYSAELHAKAVSLVFDRGSALTGLGSLVQGVSDYSRLRRLCPMCVHEDLERWRQSYWHRQHNLPGTLACTRHGVLLHVTTLPTVSKVWHGVLPEDVRVPRRPLAPTPFLTRLAQSSEALLGRCRSEPLERDASWHREQLVTKGLVSPGWAVDSRKASAWLAASMQLPPEVLGLPARDASLRWIGNMVRPGYDQPFVPLKHVLFETALELQDMLAEPILNHIPTGMKSLATPEADANAARAVLAVVRSYVARGERVGVGQALTEAGCWSRFRHSSKAYPQVQAALAYLKSSPAAMRPHWGEGSHPTEPRHRCSSKKQA